MTQVSIASTAAVAKFLALLESHEWRVSLNSRAELHVIVGDVWPGWSQGRVFGSIDAVYELIVRHLAERDGLAGLGDDGAVH